MPKPRKKLRVKMQKQERNYPKKDLQLQHPAAQAQDLQGIVLPELGSVTAVRGPDPQWVQDQMWYQLAQIQ